MNSSNRLIAIVAAVTFCVLSTSIVSGFAPSLASSSCLSSTAAKPGLQATSAESDGENNLAGDNHSWTTRRETLSRTASSLLAVSALSAGVISPQSALAAEGATTKQEIFSKLAGIPTFCLVNGPGSGNEGVPFDIYNTQTATATGYFFMSYETALRALKTASDLDAARGDENVWTTAQVKVIPLSVAIQLSLTKRRRVAVNEEKGVAGIQVDTIHNLIPSDEGNGDAQTLDTSRGKNAKKWETKGRVPIFYIPEPRLNKSYYYFNTNDLVLDYRRKHQDNDPSMAFIPEIQVAEVIDVFRKAQQTNDWEPLRDFVETIQPSQDGREAAIKLLKEEATSKGPSVAYNFDKVFLVVAASK
jgi:hypothetical protein